MYALLANKDIPSWRLVKGGRGTNRAGPSSNKSEIHCIRFNNYTEGCKGRCAMCANLKSTGNGIALRR